MLIQVMYFTENGKTLYEKLKEACPDYVLTDEYSVEKAFYLHIPIIFIGATGIAVRFISPFVKDKLVDSPVIVIDELGQFVIPILSGHVGGANAISKNIAKAIDATPVITTATDINDIFAIDVFAVKNGLRIVNKEMIKNVSSKLLKGETIVIKNELSNVTFEGDQPKNVILDEKADNPDVIITEALEENLNDLTLVPRKAMLGMGCKKDKQCQELFRFVSSEFDVDELKKDIYAITSIDVKAREVGLLALASYLDTYLITFSAEELKKVEGHFSSSSFVRETVGVDNVSERAAVALGAVLTKEKIARDGMTLAVAKRELRSLVW